MPHTVGVRLMQTRREFDRTYSYRSEVALCPGAVVAVPFGRANRPAFAVVINCENAADKALKEVLFSLAEPYRLPADVLALCLYLSDRLLCPFGEVARVALPAGLTLKIREFLVFDDAPQKKARTGLSAEQQALFDRLAEEKRIEITRDQEALCASLVGKGAHKEYLPLFAANQKTQKIAFLLPFDEKKAFYALPQRSAALYRSVIDYLADAPEKSAPLPFLCERFSLSPSMLLTMQKRGILAIHQDAVYRGAYADGAEAPEPIVLNAQQARAESALASLMGEKKGAAALLFGVTGSGKTHVMLSLAKKARRENKGVLFLVPEIALTARLAKELCAHFPNDVTVLHSGLSEGERHDAWTSLADGSRGIALGTRSAAFAPVQNLGLILMDEEQDQSYCADNAPRYHAREVARFRAAKSEALLVLSSATPDVETYYKAQTGVYTLCELSERALGAPLPRVEITDIKPDLAAHPDALIGSVLQAALAETLLRSEQAILLMNRRGYQYAPFCAACGHALTCPQCSVALTMHNGAHARARCHYCGYTIPAPDTCPQCSAKHLFYKGFGTQRLEEELARLFPTARLLRMDADTVGAKLAHDKILSAFAHGEADILFGTQMVAKGHDFENVTLVGVVMADASLYLGDYRAFEETFALLTQVIGRAGRAQKDGRAVIQTLNPTHEIFAAAAAQDYRSFYEGEIALRRAVLYPPFCCLSSFTLTGNEEKALHRFADSFNELFEKELLENPSVKLIVYGPFEPAVYKIKNTYRLKFFVKHQNDKNTRALFGRLLDFAAKAQNKGFGVYYDATPAQL